jgi:GH15 family glucan-1,4-alpha-glucosidase
VNSDRTRFPAIRIEDYALLGDLHTAALVGVDGGVDWLCLPRFDSPACFAALLGDEHAGTWRVAPAAGGAATRRRYRDDSLILETEWDTPDGTVRLVDLMPPRGDSAELVRVVEGVSGRVPMTMLLAPRFDYGHVRPWTRCDGTGMTAVAGPDTVRLHCPVPLSEVDGTVTARFTVAAGQRSAFVLSHTPSHRPIPTPTNPDRAIQRTEAFWSNWLPHRDDGPWGPAVRRALITLKALTYAPTGGVVTAATTSLPQQMGGRRNWDHRHCSLRDATSTLRALLDAGLVDDARAWRDWLVRAVAGDPRMTQSSYGLDGTRRSPEHTIDWLRGHGNSAPVRIGYRTTGQFALNVRGELIQALHHTNLPTPDITWDIRRALLDHLESGWDRPDNGLWEIRAPQQHFVHSKVMAWAGVDRAVRTAEHHGHPGPLDDWRALRARIHADVCTKGYDPIRNTFTQTYGSYGVDAALLLLPRVGFLPWRDARMRGTLDTVRRELSDGDLLMRYRNDGGTDGLPGAQGVSLAASFWLADALHGTGRHREARELFEKLLALRNDVGLLSEDHDPHTGRQLGNTPHATSMVGLVNTARLLSDTAITPVLAILDEASVGPS